MTIEQLQYFYAIYQYETFSNAAFNMNITQSALSKQIAKLEDELQLKLFDRTYRKPRLTVEGKELLQDVQQLLNDYDQMIFHVQTIKNHINNTIKLSMLPIDYNLKIKEFSKLYPHIHLIVNEIEERDLDFKDDIYILRDNYQSKAYKKRLLFKDEIVAVVSKEHPLNQYQTITIDQLQDYSIFLPPKYTSISQICIETCKNHDFEPNISRFGRIETILSLAGDNDGVALIAKTSLHSFHLSKVNIISFDKPIECNMCLYYKKNNQAVQQFIDFIK